MNTAIIVIVAVLAIVNVSLAWMLKRLIKDAYLHVEEAQGVLKEVEIARMALDHAVMHVPERVERQVERLIVEKLSQTKFSWEAGYKRDCIVLSIDGEVKEAPRTVEHD